MYRQALKKLFPFEFVWGHSLSQEKSFFIYHHTGFFWGCSHTVPKSGSLQMQSAAEISSLKIVRYMGFVMHRYGSFSVFLRSSQVDEAHIETVNKQRPSLLKWWWFCLELDDGWLVVGGQHRTKHFFCFKVSVFKKSQTKLLCLHLKSFDQRTLGICSCLKSLGHANFALASSIRHLGRCKSSKTLQNWPEELCLLCNLLLLLQFTTSFPCWKHAVKL